MRAPLCLLGYPKQRRIWSSCPLRELPYNKVCYRDIGKSGDIAIAYGQILVPEVRYVLVSWKSI